MPFFMISKRDLINNVKLSEVFSVVETKQVKDYQKHSRQFMTAVANHGGFMIQTISLFGKNKTGKTRAFGLQENKPFKH